MWIKSLTIEKFQIHKRKKKINFTKGLNVIIGETDEGKSSIIRALYLLFHNKPLNPAKVFNHKFSPENKFKIECEDSFGNILYRENKLYKLNGKEFRAFGHDIPKPISKAYPFTEINWQRQLDIHFLVTSTGGKASQFLQKYIGLEDQATIIKEIKDRISKNKSELKRQEENSKEFRDKIKELKTVPKFHI
jgi:DNA repair protein SbcC/Rad50